MYENKNNSEKVEKLIFQLAIVLLISKVSKR